MCKSIGIIAIKGGVGKTTIASSLAADLVNTYKKRVLLVDANYSAPNLGIHMDILDPEKTVHDVLAGNVRIQSAIQNRFGVDVLPGSYAYEKDVNVMRLKDKLMAVKNNYDFIVVDSSPSMNEEILSTILASDALFVVTTPDFPTLSCSLKAAKLAKQRGRPIAGIIINKIRDPGYELSLKEVEDSVGIPVVARIKDDKLNVRALFTRIPTTIYNRRTRFSKEISRLGAALVGSKERMFWKRFLPVNLRKEQVNRQLMKESFYKNVFTNTSESHS